MSYKQSTQNYPHIIVFKHQYYKLILHISNFNSQILCLKSPYKRHKCVS